MQKIDSTASLREAILILETKQADEGKMVKDQLYLLVDSLKPINLIKSTFHEAVASRDVKDNIIGTTVGLTAGYLTNVAIGVVTKNPLKKLIGSALVYGLTNLTSKHPQIIKSLGNGLLKIIRRKHGVTNHSS